PVPDPPDDRIVKIFFGRASLKVDAMAALGDRLPGTTGQQVVEGIFGRVPEGMLFAPTRRRYAHILAGLTRQHLTIEKRLLRGAAETVPWWHDRIARIRETDDIATLTRLYGEAADRFDAMVGLQNVALFCGVQPMYDALTRLAERAGLEDVTGLTSGYGGVPEAAMVGELWRCSRGELSLAEIVRRFGHHGPL